MTNEEFNFKYKDYIEPGFDGCELSNKEALDFLDSKFQEYIKIPGFKFSQIKSKFNSFRFYAEGISQEEKFLVEDKLEEIYYA